MIKVEFLGPIGLDSMEFDVNNLKELSKKLKTIDQLQEWLDICAVAVNNKIVNDIDYKFQDGDTVSLLPPVCGG
jgi:molybdopterin synthase sulfur carrier subunit